MGQSNSRSKTQSYPYPLPHPGAYPPPGAAYAGTHSVYPSYSVPPNQHLVVPYPYFSQQPIQKTRTKRRRASAGAAPTQQVPVGYTASTIGRAAARAPSASGGPVIPASVPAPVAAAAVPPPPLFTPMTGGEGDRLANFPAEPQTPNIVPPPIPRGRAQTPYHPPIPAPESDEDSGQVPPFSAAEAPSQPRRRYTMPATNLPPPPPPLLADPPGPSAFDRPLWSPSGNPLPAPPRDLFNSEAYKAVVNIPRGTDLLTALYGYQRDQNPQPGGHDPNPAPQQTKTGTGFFGRKNSRSGGGGLFRSLTGSRGRKQGSGGQQEVGRDQVRIGDVRLVPFPVPVERINAGTQPTQRAFTHVPPSQERYIPAALAGGGMTMDPSAEEVDPQPEVVPPLVQDDPPDARRGVNFSSFPQAAGPPFPVMPGPSAVAAYVPPRPSSSQINAPFPVMTAPSQQQQQQPQMPLPPLIFTQSSSGYQGFFPHSNHRVLYQNKTYPTATHLHEALKYLPAHPTIAEQIRLCVNLSDVYPLSAANTAYVRSDWGNVFLTEMEMVLDLKFRQHPVLKNELILLDGMGTGEDGLGGGGGRGREIVYRDERDMFWGDGGGDGKGANELGKVLMRVRDRLVEERERGIALRY